MTFKIEKDVPIPASNAGGREQGRGKYPWQNMEVGDSFYFSHLLRSSVHCATICWAKRNGREWAFETRDEGRGARIWRIK